jgi:protein subunit release factor A
LPATVAILPEAEDSSTSIPNELTIDVYRPSRPGGQFITNETVSRWPLRRR